MALDESMGTRYAPDYKPPTNSAAPQVNMKKLMAEIEEPAPPQTKSPVEYAPPHHRERERIRQQEAELTPVQNIAVQISELTWMEAEEMGMAIQAEMKDGVGLTAAMQHWAASCKDI